MPNAPFNTYIFEDIPTADNPESQQETLPFTSSLFPSNMTEKYNDMFPATPTPTNAPFLKGSNLPEFIRMVLKLDASFITRMEQLGITTPQLVVNYFGLNVKSIAHSFLEMGLSPTFST